MAQKTDPHAPLAYRLRPQTLSDFIGQTKTLGEGTVLRKLIEADALTSVILAGPPGTGKTTLAAIIAETTKAHFVRLNAVTSGVKDIKEVCAEAERLKTSFNQRTVLFIDEIHRFNKSQQDALLPSVESGIVVLVGATAENPYFSVNSALLSRSQVFLLTPHSEDELVAILERAIRHDDGYAGKVKVSKEALQHIASVSSGDARIALNLLELACITIGAKISREQAEALLQERYKRYDRSGEDHYDTISAFIKSMRGSDVDAALFWLFKMVKSGEDPGFLFRRMTIFASEDVGNADPRALQLVVSAWQAFEMVGFPEGEFFLAHACVYLAQAPKSNAVKVAKDLAKEAVETSPSLEVPMHLRNAPVKAMREAHGYGVGYRYPHDHAGGIVAGSYLPKELRKSRPFYEPTDRGFEQEVRERLKKVREVLGAGKSMLR
ncbi:MAG: replication-associated recombination protein A [Candidatus Peribacteraceae bacterium]